MKRKRRRRNKDRRRRWEEYEEDEGEEEEEEEEEEESGFESLPTTRRDTCGREKSPLPLKSEEVERFIESWDT
ncbi:hypothetical protein K0M31_000480 [Melipona bicolor]|uniref:Uncharacterized protein n=1 Tax=Melipona bicolor TaxID=60889 RepID=A0AA40GDM5_9HYME|nr:hypothetical protein K0M31_000480 [Melipona bicolor]